MAFTPFNRTISFNPGGAEDKWVAAELARLARDSLAEARREGSASPLHVKAVNGRLGAPEESVRPPGPIVYSFQWLSDAAVYAIAFLKVLSPRRTGRFARSFIAVADGREVRPEAIGHARVVQVVNTQPYARKIQVGSKGFESRRGLFDAAARAVRREFRGLVKVRVTFVRLSAGYRLRSGSGRRGDRAKGAELSYPALELVSETVVVN